MKIKEALIESINQGTDTENFYGPFSFTLFGENMAAIQVSTACRLLVRNMPEMRTGKNKAGGGEGIPYEEVTVFDILRVIEGGDFPRHFALYEQSRGFFR